MTPSVQAVPLPPVAAEVVAGAVEGLTSRLSKKLDAAIEKYGAVAPTPVAPDDGGEAGIGVRCGEDAVVVLSPGPSGTVTDPAQARCTCLLAPRCLHLAAVLGACPVAGPESAPESAAEATDSTEAAGENAAPAPPTTESATPASVTPAASAAPARPPAPLSPVRIAAASGLWSAATAVLAAGVPAAGAIPQAELLRAAHTARLAGLHRAEAAALRVVRGLREARVGHAGHRLADLVAALRELLLTTGLLAAGDGAPELIGTARRGYRPGGALRVHGVCREPVISATGYGGVVTHLVSDDNRWFSVADVRPGGSARARGAATAPVTVGATVLDHAQLSRGGLLINGATVSPDGRLGSGKGVRSSPVAGLPWSSAPIAALFARRPAEAVADLLSTGAGAAEEGTARTGEPIGCDLVITGAVGDQLLARELPHPDAELPTGPLIRLMAAHPHPDLAHTANLRRLATRPGLRVRVVGRIDPDRAATLRPLAVGPVPGVEASLRLPPEWLDRADLGYDRLQGAHLPPPDVCPPTAPEHTGPDLLTDSPVWRVRRLTELAVAGGRRAVAESARNGGSRGDAAALRATGFHTAAELTGALSFEADRRTRDTFGRIRDDGTDRYASAWLAAAFHLTSTERALVRASWAAE
ncbi:SWIM zinc finger family protein [Streptomyces sp. NP-1717]|uniref:SWIM zinc finger family protein n=1 Tax=Streptomyces sp. NP-1717 TaxID=2704470 RepID=UPI001F5C6997|nr:SWIM zinc finger family protein [Streptomyces sp. NP-1717]MCI3222132.1 hypothetical protein [Streptomyces sp. NP-1717]